MKPGRVRIGCSGWQYRHWRDDLYASVRPAARWLEHYATVFDTVEINNSFYRLPEADTFARWAERAPADFIYAVKASRFLTHMKKLKDPELPLRRLFDRALHLGPHLGPVLYQLPPNWTLDRIRLDDFLHALPRGRRHVVEFRNPSWYADDVLERLKAADVALCLHDMRGSATPRIRVASFVYVRLHGPSGHYAGGYADQHLRGWADWLGNQQAGGADVYAYFNNDVGGHAPRDALTLRRLMESST